jgi:Lrp/AsnC family transcriptional regulator for asnA, asnC and gidA
MRKERESTLELDDLDMKLIANLQSDGYRPHVELARALGTSKSTVTRRMHRLISNGVVRIVAAVDSDMIGLATSALIGLNVEPMKVDSILEELAAKPQVHMLASVAGRYDVVAIVAVGSSRELGEFVKSEIAPMEGVRSSETLLALEMRKGPSLFVVAQERNQELAAGDLN